MNITIIANGTFPSGDWVDALLQGADRIVCCDGAALKYVDWFVRRSPHSPAPVLRRVEVVGDGDSFDPTVVGAAARAGIVLSRHPVAEQDDNDLTKAMRFALELEPKGNCDGTEVAIVGATGLREDHTLGNISLLAWYMERYPGVRFRMLSDYGVFTPVQGHGVFASHAGQQVSLFSLSPAVPVTVEGLRWPVTDRCLGWWWEGTLNEALGDQFQVWGDRLIVYQAAKA